MILVVCFLFVKLGICWLLFTSFSMDEILLRAFSMDHILFSTLIGQFVAGSSFIYAVIVSCIIKMVYCSSIKIIFVGTTTFKEANKMALF